MMSSFDMSQSIKNQTHESFCHQPASTFEEDVLAQARKELMNKPLKQKFTPISPIREMQSGTKREYITSSRVLNSQPENTYKISNQNDLKAAKKLQTDLKVIKQTEKKQP